MESDLFILLTFVCMRERERERVVFDSWKRLLHILFSIIYINSWCWILINNNNTYDCVIIYPCSCRLFNCQREYGQKKKRNIAATILSLSLSQKTTEALARINNFILLLYVFVHPHMRMWTYFPEVRLDHVTFASLLVTRILRYFSLPAKG